MEECTQCNFESDTCVTLTMWYISLQTVMHPTRYHIYTLFKILIGLKVQDLNPYKIPHLDTNKF